MNLIFSLLKGLSVSGGLIIAIGAQNAFVIRQGLRRRHLLLTALVCSLIDALLIILGVVGFGYVITNYPIFIDLSKYLAVIFLFVYGILSFKSAFQTSSLTSKDEHSLVSAKKTAMSLLALSLLNPHVYLDTVILLGSIANQHPVPERIFFAIGAICASFIWFFALTFGAYLLAPLLKKQSAWKVIDCFIGLTMWMIAYSLL